MKIALGENERVLYRLWGAPTSRDYAMPEKLFYKNPEFEGSFILRKGRIIEIRYHIRNNSAEGQKWRSALGLWQEVLEEFGQEECLEALSKHYHDTRHIRLAKGLLIPNRGNILPFQSKSYDRNQNL